MLRYAFAGLTLVLTSTAFGQDYGNQPNVQWEPVKLEGVVKQAGGGELVVTTNANETWRVAMSAPRKDVSFTGQAEESFLKKGMFVQFVARLNKRGYAQEPIKSLMICSPDVLAGGSGEPTSSGPNLGANLFTNNTPEPEPKPKKAPKKPAPKPEETDVQVAGVVTQIRNGRMVIAAEGETVHAELADEAKLTVNLADLNWVRPGDKVEISGRMVKDRKGLAQAYTVSVAAKDPLTDEVKRKVIAKPADDKDEKAPAADPKKAE